MSFYELRKLFYSLENCEEALQSLNKLGNLLALDVLKRAKHTKINFFWTHL